MSSLGQQSSPTPTSQPAQHAEPLAMAIGSISEEERAKIIDRTKDATEYAILSFDSTKDIAGGLALEEHVIRSFFSAAFSQVELFILKRSEIRSGSTPIQIETRVYNYFRIRKQIVEDAFFSIIEKNLPDSIGTFRSIYDQKIDAMIDYAAKGAYTKPPERLTDEM